MMNFINDMGPWLLSATLKGGLLILLLVLVRRLSRDNMPAYFRYGLWALVLVRLMAPVLPESPASLFNLSSLAEQAPAQVVEQVPPETVWMEAGSVPVLEISQGIAETEPAGILFGLQPLQWLMAAWVLGMAVLLIVTLISCMRLYRHVGSLPPVQDPELIDLLNDCKSVMGIRKSVTLVETPQVRTPALMGFWRPRLLLPTGLAQSLGVRRLRYVFLHELAHLKRGDVLVNWLAFSAKVVHWFNPLVWWACGRMHADREVACDALVLSRVAGTEKREYGQAIIGLLETLTPQAPRGLAPAVVGILENRKEMKRRVAMIAKFQKSTPRLGVLALALFLGLGLVALTDASADSKNLSEKLNGPVAIEVEDASLLEVFDAFTASTGITFEFTPEAMDVINKDTKLGIQVEDTKSKNVLTMLTKTSGLAFAVLDDHIKISVDPHAAKHRGMRIIKLDGNAEDGEFHVVTDMLVGPAAGGEHGLAWIEEGNLETDEDGKIIRQRIVIRKGEPGDENVVFTTDGEGPHGVHVIELSGDHEIDCENNEDCEIKIMALHGGDVVDFDCPEGADCDVQVMAHAMFIDENGNVTKLGEGEMPEGIEWKGEDAEIQKHIKIIRQKLKDSELPEGVEIIEGDGPHMMFISGEEGELHGEMKVLIEKLGGGHGEFTADGEHQMMFVTKERLADGEGNIDKQVFVLKGVDADDLPDHLKDIIASAEQDGAEVTIDESDDRVKVIITHTK